MLFQVIAKRYEHCSVIITPNLAFSDWVTTLADDVTLTAAVLDRLLHHGHIATLTRTGNCGGLAQVTPRVRRDW